MWTRTRNRSTGGVHLTTWSSTSHLMMMCSKVKKTKLKTSHIQTLALDLRLLPFRLLFAPQHQQIPGLRCSQAGQSASSTPLWPPSEDSPSHCPVQNIQQSKSQASPPSRSPARMQIWVEVGFLALEIHRRSQDLASTLQPCR